MPTTLYVRFAHMLYNKEFNKVDEQRILNMLDSMWANMDEVDHEALEESKEFEHIDLGDRRLPHVRFGYLL